MIKQSHKYYKVLVVILLNNNAKELID